MMTDNIVISLPDAGKAKELSDQALKDRALSIRRDVHRYVEKKMTEAINVGFKQTELDFSNLYVGDISTCDRDSLMRQLKKPIVDVLELLKQKGYHIDIEDEHYFIVHWHYQG